MRRRKLLYLPQSGALEIEVPFVALPLGVFVVVVWNWHRRNFQTPPPNSKLHRSNVNLTRAYSRKNSPNSLCNHSHHACCTTSTAVFFPSLRLILAWVSKACSEDCFLEWAQNYATPIGQFLRYHLAAYPRTRTPAYPRKCMLAQL